ncbi:MAG: hypothetical protein AB1333_00150 [Patescibacteria group bacterium]
MQSVPSHVFFLQTVAFIFISIAGIGFSKKYRNPYLSIVLFFPVLYQWGKVMQIYLIGPSWVRWYVADFGFVGMGVFMAIMHTNFAVPHKKRSFDRLIKKMMRFAVIAFMIAMITELMQMAADSIPNHPKYPTAGDPIDIAMYIYSFLLITWLILKAALYEQRLFSLSYDFSIP